MSFVGNLTRAVADAASLVRFVATHLRNEYVVLDHDALGTFISVADEVLFRSDIDLEHPAEAKALVVIFPREAPNETCRELFLRAMRLRNSLRILDSRNSKAVHLLEKALRKMNRSWGVTPWFMLRSWTRSGLDARAVFAPGRPFISFTPAEIEQGWALLAHLGIGQDTEYVCFSVRDRAYLAERYGSVSSQRSSDQSTHDYRNPPLENYKYSIGRLLDEGLVVVRMGRVVEESFDVQHPNFVEYAGSPMWSDFLDVFLYANCKFAFHGGSSGIDSLAATFAKPMCVVDVVPWLHTLYSTSVLVTTPALLREFHSRRVLTIAEMVGSFRSNSSDYEDHGVSIIRNSEKEINEALLELQSRVADTWEMTDVELIIQEVVWESMPSPSMLYEWVGRPFEDGRGKSAWISTRFLDNHVLELLGSEPDSSSQVTN